jgi:hypothetical protein
MIMHDVNELEELWSPPYYFNILVKPKKSCDVRPFPQRILDIKISVIDHSDDYMVVAGTNPSYLPIGLLYDTKTYKLLKASSFRGSKFTSDTVFEQVKILGSSTVLVSRS